MRTNSGWVSKVDSKVAVAAQTKAEVVKKTNIIALESESATVYIHKASGELEFTKSFGNAEYPRRKIVFKSIIKSRSVGIRRGFFPPFNSIIRFAKKRDDTDDTGPMIEI